MQIHMTILWQDAVSSVWVPVLLFILILVLLSVLFVQSRRLGNCHRAIVHLIYEKEVLKKQLPPDSPYKYIPPIMTRSELLSIISVTNTLLAELSGERVDDLKKQVASPDNRLLRHDRHRQPSDDSVS